MKSIVQGIGKLLELFAVLMLTAMSCLVFINVVLRYGFNSSINITEEVSRFMFVWVTFLGAILAFAGNQHVRVTMFVEKMPQIVQKILPIFTDLAMLYCCYLIVDGSWIQFQLNINNLAPISGLPQGITFFASVVAGILIGLLIVGRIVSQTLVLIKGDNS